MNVIRTAPRIHPLVAVAAVCVTIVSLLGIAAITGVLPTSHGLTSESALNAGQASPSSKEGTAAKGNTQDAPQVKHAARADANSTATPQGQAPAPVQTAQKPAERNSAVGIGVGALIGGALGSQVGSGDGKTLATIAGAVGGGYIGNEIAKKNQK